MTQTLDRPSTGSKDRARTTALHESSGARSFLAHDPTPSDFSRPWASLGREVRAGLRGGAQAVRELQRRRNPGGE